MLFAVFERRVERVTLVDRKRPPSHTLVREALCTVAPWADEKIHFAQMPISHVAETLSPSCAVVAVHACGVRTDRCIDVALRLNGPVALMPCCYAQTAKTALRCLRKGLGAEMATDVHRTYRLDAAGYDVVWTAVPRSITPKNRVLVAVPTPGSEARLGSPHR
jgi:hypothetical protein